jgi:hypothetical protein
MTDHPFPDEEQRGTGYRIEDEDVDTLMKTSMQIPFCAADLPPRDLIDPRPILPVVNQNQTSGCTGNQGAGYILPWCNWLDGGEMQAFSRMFCYREAQQCSNPAWVGHDCGAAIVGVALGAEKFGIPLEIHMPWTGHYYTKVPDGVYEEAAKHKLASHTVLRSYADAYAFLLGQLGAIEIGVSLVQSIDKNNTGVIEELSGSSRGGHAMGWVEISPRKDRQGRNYFWGANSWGPGWGKGGWAEWSPSVIDSICRNQTAIGFSTLQVYDPRVIDWSMKTA